MGFENLGPVSVQFKAAIPVYTWLGGGLQSLSFGYQGVGSWGGIPSRRQSAWTVGFDYEGRSGCELCNVTRAGVGWSGTSREWYAGAMVVQDTKACDRQGTGKQASSTTATRKRRFTS